MRRVYEFAAIAAGVGCMLLAGSGVLVTRWTWPLLVVGATIVALAAWLTSQAAADRRAEHHTNRVLQALDTHGVADRLAAEVLAERTERLLGDIAGRLARVHGEIVDVLTAPMPDTPQHPADAPDWRPAEPAEPVAPVDDPDPPTTTFPAVTDPSHAAATSTAAPAVGDQPPDPPDPGDPLDPTWTWTPAAPGPVAGDTPGPASIGWQADRRSIDDEIAGWAGPGWDRQEQGGRR